MTWRKGLALLWLLATMASLLAGCGGGSEETGGEASGSGFADMPGTDIGSTPQETITLRFLSWQSNMKEEEAFAAKTYMAAHPHIRVVFEYLGEQNAQAYLQQVDRMARDGEAMDIVMAPSFQDYAARAGAKAYYPLKGFFSEEGVDAAEVYAYAPEIDGELYGIPGDWKSWFVLINKDLLDEAGLAVPDLDWTWDDYRDYAVKLTKEESGEKVYGSYFHTWEFLAYVALISTRMDNSLINPDGTFNFDDPALREWMAYRNQLENVDQVSLPHAEAKAMSADYRAKFFSGEVAMLPVGTWMIPEIDDEALYPHDFTTTFAPLPAWPEGGVPGRSYTESHFYAVAVGSGHPKEAYDFIRYFTTEGTSIRGKSISAEKGIDKMEYINNMIDDARCYDMEALAQVMNNPKWEDNIFTFIPAYHRDVEVMLMEEVEQYWLGSQSLDEAFEAIEARAEAIRD